MNRKHAFLLVVTHIQYFLCLRLYHLNVWWELWAIKPILHLLFLQSAMIHKGASNRCLWGLEKYFYYCLLLCLILYLLTTCLATWLLWYSYFPLVFTLHFFFFLLLQLSFPHIVLQGLIFLRIIFLESFGVVPNCVTNLHLFIFRTALSDPFIPH